MEIATERADSVPQRDQSAFEDFPNYPRRPAMPIQDLSDVHALPSIGVLDEPSARQLLRWAFRISGFSRFQTRLARDWNGVLKAGDVPREAYGPTTGAAMALADLPQTSDPLLRAAAMVKAAWTMHAQLRAGLFPPDCHNGEPLEMRQYLNFFGTTVALSGDVFRLFKTYAVKRILVLARGRQYLLDLPDMEGTPTQVIVDALSEIWRRAQDSGSEPFDSIGLVMCSSNRIQRGALRSLLENPGNVEAYRAAKNSFLTVCLDLNCRPSTYGDACRTAQSANFANRWFPSSFQIVVFGNGKACAIFNYSAGVAGNEMTRIGFELYHSSAQWASDHDNVVAARAAFSIREVSWDLGRLSFEPIRKDVERVLLEEHATFEITGIGRRDFDAAGFSGVPLFTIAVYMAGYALTGRHVRIRQFLAVTKYSCQTVTVGMVSTPEMRALLNVILGGEADSKSLKQLARAAIESQERECRLARSSFSLARALALYRSIQKGWRKSYVEWLFRTVTAIIAKRKLNLPDDSTDILISHPTVRTEIPVVGRAGIRLPYLNCFGLHYAIFEDRIAITVVPSGKWKFANAEVIQKISENLILLLDRLAPNRCQEISGWTAGARTQEHHS